MERFTFSGAVIALDFLIRLLFFDLWLYLELNDWLFWGMQILGVPALVLFLAFNNYERLLEKHRAKFLIVEGGPWALIFILFVLVTVTVGAYSATEEWALRSIRLIFTVSTFVLYGVYVAGLFLLSPSGRPWSPPFEEQHTIEHADDLDPMDLNDLRIAKMETDTFSITHRVETYTLESALFGALAFSGFLTILSGDVPVLPKIEELRKDIELIWHSIRTQPLPTAKADVAARITPDDVIAAVTVETLVASILFLLVILSRLRFYNILKRVDQFVRAARAMNDKEDQVHLSILEQSGNIPALTKRRTYLTRRVNQLIGDAELSFDNMQPMVRYMLVFRTLGITTFLFILLTSAFLVSTKLCIAFLALTVAAYSYMHLDKRMHERRFRQMALKRLRKVREARRAQGTTDTSPAHGARSAGA